MFEHNSGPTLNPHQWHYGLHCLLTGELFFFIIISSFYFIFLKITKVKRSDSRGLLGCQCCALQFSDYNNICSDLRGLRVLCTAVWDFQNKKLVNLCLSMPVYVCVFVCVCACLYSVHRSVQCVLTLYQSTLPPAMFKIIIKNQREVHFLRLRFSS